MKLTTFDGSNHAEVAASLRRARARINARILGRSDASFWGDNIVTSPANNSYPVIGRDHDGSIRAEWVATWEAACQKRGVDADRAEELMNMYR